MLKTPFRIAGLREVPPDIWALGFVSLLMDVSSETIHALLPVYLVTVLGASMTTVGIADGRITISDRLADVLSGDLV